jgi:uncharacterized protein YjbJ (UPF0337 family)
LQRLQRRAERDDARASPCRSRISGTPLARTGSFDIGAIMDKDRVKGATKDLTGKAKTKAGKMLGDEKLKNEGRADRVKGKVQNSLGGIKDEIRDADDRADDSTE